MTTPREHLAWLIAPPLTVEWDVVRIIGSLIVIAALIMANIRIRQLERQVAELQRQLADKP